MSKNERNKRNEKEFKCYVEIIESFENKEINREKIEIWKNLHLVKLMKKYNKNDLSIKGIITNTILIMNALFEDNPPDTFHSIGYEIEKLTFAEKDECRYNLKKELVVW